jgi:glutamate dehydrogenase/leucine dehydrogenase
MKSIESLIHSWSGEEVLIRFDRLSGAWIVIAIHSTRLGPATGGTRMKRYPDLVSAVTDALRLAEGMTYKFAVAGLDRGGGKAVIALPGEFDPSSRNDLLRRYGGLIHQLGGLYETGPDVGTSAEDMDVIAETGAPHIFCRTPAHGGAGDSSPPTAAGVHAGIKAVCGALFDGPTLGHHSILVQGAGSVGARLVDLLLAEDARVLLCDVNPDQVKRFRDVPGVTVIDPEAVFDTPCDVFAPCALGGGLNKDTIPRLICLGVAGAANNQLAEESDAERLRARNILYAPDYIVNIGGALAIPGIELEGWSPAEAEERVRRKVEETLKLVFELADRENVTTLNAARTVARSRLDG